MNRASEHNGKATASKKSQATTNVPAKKRASLAETIANSTSLVQKTTTEEDIGSTKPKVVTKIMGLLTGPGPAATAIGNPKPTAAIAKPSIKNKPPLVKNTTAQAEIKPVEQPKNATTISKPVVQETKQNTTVAAAPITQAANSTSTI